MWNKVKIFFFSFVGVPLLMVAMPVLAVQLLDSNTIEGMKQPTNDVAAPYDPETNETTLAQYVADIINVILGLLAVIFIVLIIIAGYNWMTAQGDAGKVKTAQTTIRVAVIGLAILVSAYAITWWIFGHLPDNQERP